MVYNQTHRPGFQGEYLMGKRGLKLIAIVLMFWSVFMAHGQDNDYLPPQHGRIAYVGVDANIYVLSADGVGIAITDDASQFRRYEWPTWSTAGHLAYFGSALDANGIFMTVYVSERAAGPGEVVYNGQGEAFNYAYWAPGDCNAGLGCRDLAVLISSPRRGMFVELIRARNDAEPEGQSFPGGPPFYYSWSPDGSRMLWHRRVFSSLQFDVFDASISQVIDTLALTPGLMNAPAWSPIDDRLLFAVRSETGERTNLIIVDPDETVSLAAGLAGPVAFSWSPDGQYVAYRVFSNNAYGPLVVVDARDGRTMARSPSNGVIAFFWSPDSSALAYITSATAPGSFNVSDSAYQLEQGLSWSILDIGSGLARRYGAFMPTGEMRYLLVYFDQFAQSHRVWSPDSRYLIYSEIGPGGPVVSVLDATRADSAPLSVAEGFIGIWSFE
jgi:TolB protein